MNLSPEVHKILALSTILGADLRLPPGRLDAKLYKQVNTVLEIFGGVWHRATQCHRFSDLASVAKLVEILKHGSGTEIETLKDRRDRLQAFFTPEPLAAELAAHLKPELGDLILEPSAGDGALIKACASLQSRIKKIVAVEIDEAHCGELRKLSRGVSIAVYQADFLAFSWPGAMFNGVIMNPPFAGGQDIRHVLRAWQYVAADGRLVAVVGAGAMTYQSAISRKLATLVDKYGRSFDNEPDAFKTAGAAARTKTIILNMPHPIAAVFAARKVAVFEEKKK